MPECERSRQIGAYHDGELAEQEIVPILSSILKDVIVVMKFIKKNIQKMTMPKNKKNMEK